MTYADTLAMTLAGERLGYEAALLAEHYYPSGPLEAYPNGFKDVVAADAWIYLAGLARDTTRIRLGTLVSPVTFRHPAVLAKMAASLDELSNGRAELGLGAGWLEVEHRTYGFDFPPAPRRVDLVEEQLQVITGLWSQHPFSHHGRAYHLADVWFTPQPVQQPRPTVIVGGSSRARRLPKLAARYADEYVINSPSLEQCRAARQALDTECERHGRDPVTLRLSAFVPICVGQTAADVQRALDAYLATNPQYIRMMANRANWIEGTPAQAVAQLQALEHAGIDRALISVNTRLHLEMLPLLIS